MPYQNDRVFANASTLFDQFPNGMAYMNPLKIIQNRCTPAPGPRNPEPTEIKSSELPATGKPGRVRIKSSELPAQASLGV